MNHSFTALKNRNIGNHSGFKAAGFVVELPNQLRWLDEKMYIFFLLTQTIYPHSIEQIYSQHYLYVKVFRV